MSNIINKELRKKQQDKSKEIGRCVCSMKYLPFPCECPFFKDKGICHCAGEKHEGVTHQEWLDYNLSRTQNDTRESTGDNAELK